MSSTAAVAGVDVSELEAPLLLDDVVRDSVDFHGRPAVRSKTGYWKSASFMIGVEVAERFAYYGISANLISYLTGPLGQSTAAAAANVNAWSGTASLLPLLCGFIADSYLGRYRTVVISSVVYILGLGFLTLSAALSSTYNSNCEKATNSACSPPTLQVFFFFFSLYLVALAQGGHKPCIQAFGADQFDEADKKERLAKSSFFNWWYFSTAAGVFLSQLVLSYVQENMSWELGFGIPAIFMVLALVIFLLGSTTYRFGSSSSNARNPFMRIGLVYVRSARSWFSGSDQEQGNGDHSGVTEDNKVRVCTAHDVEDAKAILRLVPIWCTCLAYAIVFAQAATLFTKQGATMDRAITATFEIPAASFQSIIHICVVIMVPIYDRVLVPAVRTVTKKPAGITMLQRIGIGMFFSVMLMVTAALVEMRRLATAREHGLVDQPDATVPMSAWWLAPQYVVFGVADVFAMIGLQEFFYDQVPADLKSVGLALYLSVFGVGSFLSGFLISIIDSATSRDGGDSWFSSNLNRGHIDYFYWLLAAISGVMMLLYFYYARSYVYKRKE